LIDPAERRARDKAALRDKILDAARSLFAKEGVAAVTMRELAGQIGYTATAIYYHFPDKESLLRELCETDFRALRAYFAELGQIANPVERLRVMAEAYVRFGLQHPQQYRLMFMTPQAKPSGTSIERGNPDQDSYAFLLETVREAMRAGLFRSELTDPELIAQSLWAGVHGLVALHLNKGDDDWVQWRDPLKTAELMGASLMTGFLKVRT
jgi:AcrR family transcriptional regulator